MLIGTRSLNLGHPQGNSMDLDAKRFCLRWKNDSPKCIWYIFGLSTKGEYYGEIQTFVGDPGEFSNVTGCLTPVAMLEVLELIERIRARPDRLANTNNA